MMKFSSTSLIVSLLFVLASCSSMNIERKDYGRSENFVAVPKVKTTLKVRQIWAKDAGSPNQQEFSKLVPSVSEQGIFTVSENGLLTAWQHRRFPNFLFKQKHWQKQLFEEISAGVFEGYGVVLLATAEGKVLAFDSKTGDALWEKELNGEVLAPPQGNGRFAIVQMTNGIVYGLDFTSGEEKWRYKTTVPALSLRGTTTPVIERNIVYTGFASGKVVALDIVSGTALWEMYVYLPEGGTELEQVVDVDGNLLLDNHRLFAASYQGKVVALAKADGRPLWKNNASNYLGLEQGLNQIYSIEEDGLVRAYHVESGKLIWEQDALKNRLLGAPAIQQNFLVVGDLQGYLYWLDQETGELRARKYLGRGWISTPHQWDAKGVQRKAEKTTAFRLFSKPVVKDGILYVQSQFGALAAYKIVDSEK